jgi:hypothetical protein
MAYCYFHTFTAIFQDGEKRYRLKEKIVHSSGKSDAFIDFQLFPTPFEA